jgi:hypothetical protein
MIRLLHIQAAAARIQLRTSLALSYGGITNIK